MNREDALRFVDAYVDDELSVKDALEVQTWIQKDDEVRAEYEQTVAQKRTMKELLEDSGPEAPELLKRRVVKAMRSEWRHQHPLRRPALAVAAAFLLVIFGWAAYQRTVGMPAALVAEAMSIYKVEIQNPLDFRSSDIKQVRAWLNEKFQQDVRPIMFDKGKLLGVRLCPFAGQKGAFVRYRIGGRNMALFIGDRKGIPYSMPMVASFKVGNQKIFEAQKGGFRLAFWKKGMWFYALVIEDAADNGGFMRGIFKGKSVMF